MARRKRRGNRGQSLIETMIGFMVLIPIGLAAINVVCLVSTSQNNEQWAEMAARAAAQKASKQDALNAAQFALEDCQRNSIVQDVKITKLEFDPVQGHVLVSTNMAVKLPVPIPGFSEVNCTASSIQPIVSIPAPR